MTTEEKYCCDDFKKAVEGTDKVIMWSSFDEKYSIDAFDLIEDYLLNYCPFCGKKLKGEFH